MNLHKLFLASYLSSQASTYFNRVLMVSSLAQHPDEKVSEFRDSFFESLRNSGRQYVDNIKNANEIYSDMDLPELDLPRFPEDYFKWMERFRKNIRNSVENQSEDQLIIDYAFYMASICSDLAILVWALYLHQYAPNGPNQAAQLKKSIDDSKNAKFIWAGTAVLLGQREDLRFLWEEWQSLDNLLDQFYAFAIPENTENIVEAISFADALLPKFHEKVDFIVGKLKALD
jgi:hypothetical protein